MKKIHLFALSFLIAAGCVSAPRTWYVNPKFPPGKAASKQFKIDRAACLAASYQAVPHTASREPEYRAPASNRGGIAGGFEQGAAYGEAMQAQQEATQAAETRNEIFDGCMNQRGWVLELATEEK